MSDKAAPENQVAPESEAAAAFSQLHDWENAGNLQLLVGAGVSIGSGFPTWQELNLALVGGYASAKYGTQDLTPAEHVDQFARQLYDVIGRDGVADFIRATHGTTDQATARFNDALANALYTGRRINELPVRSAQKQLAAMVRRRSQNRTIFTTNFDPLLELALSQLDRLDGRQTSWDLFRSPPPMNASSTPRTQRVMVEHLHGWVDPGGKSAGPVVLTESDYLDLVWQRGQRANKLLTKLVNDGKPLLIVGMSLGDPNLRRVLHARRRFRSLRSPESQIFAILAAHSAVLDKHLRSYWEGWGVNLILLENHEQLPEAIRKVAWGAEPGLPWFRVAQEWVTGKLPESTMFSDAWQEVAHRSLELLKSWIEKVFAVPHEERLELSLFVPRASSPIPAICAVAASRREKRGGDEARAHAACRELRLENPLQGVAGEAYVTGCPRFVVNDGPGINHGFTEEMRTQWRHDFGRDWRSILAVPVMDTGNWLPVAVINVTSTFGEPFWRRFGDGEQRRLAELKELMRRTAKSLVAEYEGKIRFIEAATGPSRVSPDTPSV